jgi:hypothetical protein
VTGTPRRVGDIAIARYEGQAVMSALFFGRNIVVGIVEDE